MPTSHPCAMSNPTFQSRQDLRWQTCDARRAFSLHHEMGANFEAATTGQSDGMIAGQVWS